jgi:hypothetical protein
MASAVMRGYAIAALPEEQHLSIPVVVENICSVFRGDRCLSFPPRWT